MVMRALGIAELSVNADVAAKLEAKHGVTVGEAEEAVFAADTQIRRGRAGLYLLYGCTEAGRYLFVVIATQRYKARLVTARDMTPKERRLYGRQVRR